MELFTTPSGENSYNIKKLQFFIVHILLRSFRFVKKNRSTFFDKVRPLTVNLTTYKGAVECEGSFAQIYASTHNSNAAPFIYFFKFTSK